ncbi:ArdC family protein [Acidobacteria bacterium AH-259-O06]|nr:ArdC family protein [Acidobacteria bacterium AH-259-O06]
MNKAFEVITDTIVRKLEEGTVPWHQPWSTEMPKNLISKRTYKGINVFLLGSKGYANPYWLTFKQAKRFGGHIRQGEKSTPVVFWKWIEKENNDGEKESYPVLRYYNVFNVSQCEGIPAEKIPPLENQRDFHPIHQAEKTVQRGCHNVQRLSTGRHRLTIGHPVTQSTCPRRKSLREMPNITAPSFMS